MSAKTAAILMLHVQNAAKNRAEARLADATAKVDADRAQAALARSLARLKAALNK